MREEVNDIFETLRAYLATQRGPSAYAIFALSAGIEYIFPPFPGDALALLAVALASTASYSWASVYAALTLGATVGGGLTAELGRWLGRHRERWPRLLRRKGVETKLNTIQERFQQRGGVYLSVNRFIPAFRSLFFLAAGLARLPRWQVWLYGGISAALWNLLLVGAGRWLGGNWQRLSALFQRYTWVVLALVLVGVTARLYWVKRKKKGQRAKLGA